MTEVLSVFTISLKSGYNIKESQGTGTDHRLSVMFFTS